MKNNKKVRRNPKPMSLDSLIYEIESLENDNIISFDEFKRIPIYEIKGEYFPMIHPTLIRKAIIKIEDEKSGNTGLSSLTSISEIYKDEKVVIKKRIDYF